MIEVLVRGRPGRAPAPETFPIGRAALAAKRRGVDVCFGDLVPVPGGWTPRASPVRVQYDRYPAWSDPQGYAAALRPGVPLANPAPIDALCRDKVACQRALEAAGVSMPQVEVDPGRFQERLQDWGAGFLKPRFGGLGAGVRRVEPGDPLPVELPGATGVLEPSILQRAVPPWSGAACALRMLVQRDLQGWHVVPVVARVSDTDPVANVERGAQAVPAIDHLPPDTVAAARDLAVTTAAALADPWTVELGVDAVVDRAGNPWLIEVNGRPKGRLEALAHAHPERFAQAHLDACVRPLVWLHMKIGLDTPRPGI